MNDNYMSWYEHMNDISYKIVKQLDSIQLPFNPVVIFDIDNTLLHSNGTCIMPIVNVYNHVKKIGIIPIIITNRLGIIPIIEFTQNQLKNCGITGYKSIYFRDPEKDNDAYTYKKKARHNVYKRGMNILMSIGDKKYDIGDYGGIGVIVPILKKK